LGLTDEDRRVVYRQLFKTITPEDELTTIRDATNKGWALGSDRFASEIEALSERRAVSKGRGRPQTRITERVACVAENNGV
jgi:putative transposase